jgi:hypothetical protein
MRYVVHSGEERSGVESSEVKKRESRKIDGKISKMR